MKNAEFFKALDLIEAEKGIPADYMLEKVENAFGTGFRAEFFIPKTDGQKADIQVYETYQRGLKHSAVIERVERFINASRYYQNTK